MQTDTAIASVPQTQNRSGKALLLTASLATLVLVALVFTVIFLGGEIRRHYSFQNLVAQLEHGTAQSGQDALDSYLADSHAYEMTRKIVYPFQYDTREYKRQAVQNLFQVVYKIALNDFQGAVLFLRDLVRPQINTILASMSLTQEDKALLHDILARNEKWSKEVLTLARLESTGPGILKENADRIAEQTMLAEEVAIEFGRFMSLPHQTYAEGESMVFYKSGVLKGLPLLRGLPDGIDSLHELKVQLDTVGGKPEVQGPNAPEQFERKIAELRSNSAVFRETLTSLTGENREIEEQTVALRKSVYQESQRVQKDIISLIERIARPELSTAAHWLLQLIGR